MAMDEGPLIPCLAAFEEVPLVLEFALTGKWWRAIDEVPSGQSRLARHHQNTARKAESEGPRIACRKAKDVLPHARLTRRII